MWPLSAAQFSPVTRPCFRRSCPNGPKLDQREITLMEQISATLVLPTPCGNLRDQSPREGNGGSDDNAQQSSCRRRSRPSKMGSNLDMRSIAFDCGNRIVVLFIAINLSGDSFPKMPPHLAGAGLFWPLVG